jgi:hypothetical protein
MIGYITEFKTPNRRLESIQEWSDFMKTSSAWNFRSIVGKVMMGLVLAAMIGSIDVAPAFGQGDHKRMGKHDNRRYEPSGRVYHRDNRGREYYRDRHGKRFYRSYGYREPVYYPPPPVVYAPPPPPGVSIFFPPIFFPPFIIRP